MLTSAAALKGGFIVHPGGIDRFPVIKRDALPRHETVWKLLKGKIEVCNRKTLIFVTWGLHILLLLKTIELN